LIDSILEEVRRFARTFIDDIIAASNSLEEHVSYLRQLFQLLVRYNIALNPQKCFLSYLSATILGRHVDSLGLATTKDRLEAMPK
jgi:hypothetical protein